MAYNYQNYEKFYNAMNDSQRAKWNEQNKNDADFNDFLSKYNAKNQTSTPVSTGKASSQTAVPEYWGTWASNAKQSNYVNQWEGNYKYNPTTWYYEKQWTTNNSNATKANTTPTQAWTPTSTTNNTNATKAGNAGTISAMKEYWEWLDYDQQQEKIKASPWLQEWLAKYGITSKTKPAEWTTNQTGTTTPTTPSKWDYSDNSPERMGEIADNLERYYITNPWLFANEDAFRNFFIDWKWRTPEQEQFLMDYFKNRQIYNEYDWYTAEKVWYMQAHWQVPQSYLNYLKNSNPDRYNAVMDYKDQTEKGIEDESYYNTLLANSGDPEWMKRAKENWFIIDVNKDNLDDRLYHAPTEEEQTLVTEYSTLASEQLADANAYRDLQEDLTEQYPDADLSTIMLLAWDRWKKIQDRMDTRNVTMTKLQGQIEYLQKERSTQDAAGQKTISELQKAYGMYYTYSPEWMSELAQAQYAATNVTLDQADNWTDTQKQMALQSVLDDYYAKYWDIIQRSEAQVINDVMAYAKKNGVSLSQALEENFLKPLRSKPQFATLSSGWSLNADPYVVKVWDVAYRYNPETDEFELIGWNGTIWWALGGWTTNWELYGFTNYTPITTEKKESTLDSFMSGHPLNSTWWECGSFVNDYLQALWYDRLYDDPIDKKKAVTNSDTATVWSIAVLNSKKYPQYWHTAIITDVQWDKVKLLESNWNDDHQVHERWVNKSEILWYFDPSKEPTPATTTNQNNKYWNKSNWNPNWYSDNLTWEYEAYLADPTYENNTDFKYKLWEFWISFEDFTEQAKNYARTWMKDSQVDSASNALEAAINLYEYVNWNKSTLLWFSDSKQWWLFDWLGWHVPKLWWDAYDAKWYYDTLWDRLTLDKLIETKKQWATYWAMSEWEWKLLKNAATSLDWGSSSDKFQKNLEDLIWTLTRTVHEWWWKLPSNFANSAASKYVLESWKSWKYNSYLKDNTPMNYNSNNTAPSRLS